jgi:hypothetical protein
MGASGWAYFADYDPDPAKALEKLRANVFASGKFGEAHDWETAVQQMEAMLQDAGPLREILERRMKADMERHGGRKPRTIAEALDQAAEEGTHSILDIMCGISEEPKFATAFPAPDDWLIKAYGTKLPTREQVESMEFSAAEDLERWSAVFFPVCETAGGEPRWWRFEGCSGD